MTGSLAPLRYPAFRLLAAGRIVTMAGNSVAPIAWAFAVLDLTGSVAALGIVVGARSLTNVLFLLFGGVVADRLPRNVVLTASGVLSALSQGMVAALVLSGTASVTRLAVLSAVNGMLTAFAFPASAALTPQTVPPQIRRQANALMRLGINAGMILGASCGGLLVAIVGPGWGLAVDAAAFLVAGCCFGLVRAPGVTDPAGARSGPLADLREGWTEFVARTWVWLVVVAFAFINAALVAAVQVLGPAVADETVGRRAWGFVLAAQTAGMVAGGLIALRLRVRRLLFLGVVCVGGMMLLPLALAVCPVTAVLLTAAFVGGLGIEQFVVAWDTSLQEHIPAHRLARVYSYDCLGSFVAIPVAQVAVGPIAHLVGVVPTLLGSAATALVATLVMLSSRSVRELEHNPSGTAEPATAPAAV